VDKGLLDAALCEDDSAPDTIVREVHRVLKTGLTTLPTPLPVFIPSRLLTTGGRFLIISFFPHEAKETFIGSTEDLWEVTLHTIKTAGDWVYLWDEPTDDYSISSNFLYEMIKK